MADVVINVGAVSAITAGTGLTGGTITGTGTIAASFGTSAGTICQGNDSRLTNGRTPTTHASTHATGGGDPVTLDQSQITDLTADLAAKVAGTRQVIAGTGLGGGGTLSADVTLTALYGTSGSTACVGNDARLSNARTPSTHASTHSAGGSDAITITQAQVTDLATDLALKASTTHASTHATGGTDVLTLGQAQITGLVTALAAKALGATTMTAGTGLTGGGDLSANRSFAVAYGTSSTTATVGNDARLSFLAAGVAATSRTLQNKLRDMVSVKDFGATGDGTTDDTVALQAALDEGAGESVYFPAGSYKTTAALNISANTYVYADDASAVINVQPTASAATFNNGLMIMGDGITIDGLKIVGTNEGQISSGTIIDLASAMYAQTRDRLTVKNCQIVGWCRGTQLRGCKSFTIQDNRYWGGAQQGNAVTDNSTSDIFLYGNSGTQSSRGIVSGNFCLGNQDVPISTGVNGGDANIVIDSNVIWPLQSDGLTVLTNPNNKSRYGIGVGYVGNISLRTIVSNNIIRDVAYAGINMQTATLPGGDISVTGNVISNCGFGEIYTTDGSLKGGIWIAGGADTVSGNVIVDCYRAGISLTWTIAPSSSVQDPCPVVSGNNISRIAIEPITSTGGWGIYVGGKSTGLLISSNRIQSTVNAGIYCDIGAGADVGNNHFIGNHIDTDVLFGGIRVSNGGSLDCSVIGNKINGSDNTTTNGGLNTGILVTAGTVHCSNNVVTKFYEGIKYPTFARNVTTQASGNVVTNCRDGIGCSGAGPWIITDNIFNSCTNRQAYGGAWQGIMYKASANSGFDGGPVIHVADTAAPTAGTWVVGDHCAKTNVAVGQPKGYFCTVAGTPGDWTSEGNL
jgi:hypothetical protein